MLLSIKDAVKINYSATPQHQTHREQTITTSGNTGETIWHSNGFDPMSNYNIRRNEIPAPKAPMLVC